MAFVDPLDRRILISTMMSDGGKIDMVAAGIQI